MARGDEKTYIYGKHAVSEALRNAPRCVEKVLLSPDTDDDSLRSLIRKAGASIVTLESGRLPKEMDEMAAHQGVVALIDLDKLVLTYEAFTEHLSVGPDTSLILLNELQDPQNVGAIIRSAAAFGVSGILVPEHNQAPITGTVVKVSAGMAFRIPLVSIGNVNNTIRDLKEKRFWIYGLTGGGENPIGEEKFDAPAVFVLGNEAKGIREKTLEHCDILLSIPVHPRCESLNVAASAAVTLYAWSAQHPRALK